MKLDYAKYADGLIPAIVQDAETRKVLMLGFMNAKAIASTETTGRVTFYSRSKQRLWTKGETSGNFLELVSITPDCDSDSLLIIARPRGPVCHVGSDTCFAEANTNITTHFLTELELVIADRFQHPVDGSYTSTLFENGRKKIAQKVGEEAVEVVLAAQDDDIDEFKNEVADLVFHLLLLLKTKDVTLDDVIAVLKERRNKRGR